MLNPVTKIDNRRIRYYGVVYTKRQFLNEYPKLYNIYFK